MGLKARWRTGACSAGILLACAVAACSDSTEPGPGSGPSGACAPTLQLSQSVVDLSALQQIRLTVTAPPNCQWTVVRPQWVRVVSQYSGSGSYNTQTQVGTGTVTLWLQLEPATAPRYSTMSVSVLNSSVPLSTVWLYQEDGCSFRTDPQFLQFDGAGGRASVGLSASPPCAWSLDMPTWIRVEPQSGSGSATLAIDVAPTESPRAGLISTAGRSLGVRQTPAGMSPVFAFARLSCGAIRPGESIVGLCYFEAVPATNPASSQIGLALDMRPLGGSDNVGLNPDMGTDGRGFFVDVRAGASVLPGLKAIPLTARDAQGRTATATATLSVLPPK